jgi:hypothetical protein
MPTALRNVGEAAKVYLRDLTPWSSTRADNLTSFLLRIPPADLTAITAPH